MNITAVIVAVLMASVITAVGGFWLLPMLRRLHFGQTILEIGPKWHQGKQGTPTMGGLMFIIGIAVSYFILFPLTFRFLGTYQVSADIPNCITLSSYISTLCSLSLASSSTHKSLNLFFG